MVNSVFKVHNVNMRYTKKIIAAFATILLVMTTAITVKAEVDIDRTFKDEAFRKYIKTFDRNGDGALDDEEISDIKAIHIIDDKNGTIKDLTGIECLTSLEVLEIANMQITDVNLTKNTSLKEVYLMNDKVETLDITGIKTLKAFAISRSSIKSLDISANKELESLVIIGLANLKELKLDGLDKLSGLQTEDTAITKLDLKDKTALTALYLSNNKLIGLDLSNSTSLKVLLIDKNPLVYLNLSNSPYLTYDNSTENTIDGVIGPDYDITKELPGFEVERIKDLKGTTLSDGKFSDLSLGENTISYYYEITTGKYLDVDLTINVTKLIPQVTIVGNPSHIHGKKMNIKVESDSNGTLSYKYQV